MSLREVHADQLFAAITAYRDHVAPAFDWLRADCTCGLRHEPGQFFDFDAHWERHCLRAAALQEAAERAIKLAERNRHD